MDDSRVAPVDWAKSVQASDVRSLGHIEDRILAAGVPGGSRPRSTGRRPTWLWVSVTIALVAAPIAGLAAFMGTFASNQGGFNRHYHMDLEAETRLWLAAAAFTVACLEPLLLLFIWWKSGRGRAAVMWGLCLGIAGCAALALYRATLIPEPPSAGGFDPRLSPAVVTIITGLAAAGIQVLGSRHTPRPLAEPSWIPVDRTALTNLSPNDMSALLDERRRVLEILSQRGLIRGDVDELDRKPLGSLG